MTEPSGTHLILHDPDATKTSGRASSVWVLLLSFLLAALILMALYGRIMGYDLRRDELMFVPPATLMPGQDPYSGFFYNHVPYSGWLFWLAYHALPGLGLLASARMMVFLAWVMLLATAAWFGYRLTGRRVVAAFAPLVLLATDTLLAQTGMAATNNLLPLPFAMLALALIALALAERYLNFRQLFLAGLCLSLAAGMKASAIAFVPPVVIACLILPREMTLSERLNDLALPVALGGLVGAVPLFWLALTEPTFFDHILRFHSGPHIAYWRDHAASEPDLAIGLGGKVKLAQAVWLTGAPLLGSFVVGFAIVLLAATRARKRGWEDATDGIALIGGAALCAAALAFVPTPGFPQYYAPPLIALPLMATLAYRCLPTGPERLALHRGMGVGVVLLLVLAAPRLALGLNDLRNPQGWMTARMSRAAEALRTAITEHGGPEGPVATLSPLYPLEAGLPVYAEFATGPFAWRIAEYTDPELASSYVMTGPKALDALFEARPPAALLTGFDPGLEAPLEDWARAHGYTPTPLPAAHDRYGTGRLWLPVTGAADSNPEGDMQ